MNTKWGGGIQVVPNAKKFGIHLATPLNKERHIHHKMPCEISAAMLFLLERDQRVFWGGGTTCNSREAEGLFTCSLSDIPQAAAHADILYHPVLAHLAAGLAQ